MKPRRDADLGRRRRRGQVDPPTRRVDPAGEGAHRRRRVSTATIDQTVAVTRGVLALARVMVGVCALVGCHRDGGFDRLRSEQVVELVRARVHDVGRIYRFRLDTNLDPGSLRELPPGPGPERGEGRGVVRAAMSASHALAVSIETRDDGHAGEYGFLYADPGCTPGDLELVRRNRQHEERLDARWLRWKFDLE